MARIEDGGQTDTGLEGLDHDAVHFIVDDVASHTKIHGVNDLIVTVLFITVCILGLAAVSWRRGLVRVSSWTGEDGMGVTGIVEKEGVVGFRILDQPVHGAQDVCLGRLAHGVLLIVGQDDHVLAGVAEVAIEVCRHILDIVDAAPQLASLPEIVDTDQKGLSSSGTVGVLKGVVLGRAGTEALQRLWRWWWGIVIAVNVGV